jgi:S-DNA-T family DNA segregation ATPase FtsK/SpoIIIE
MDRLFFTEDEKTLFERILVEGLGQASGFMWWPVRFAIARSLQIEDAPDERFKAPPSRLRASELHLRQVTGAGQRADPMSTDPVDPDYDDAIMLLLTVKHGEDVFADPDRYIDLLQRHARRGLEVIGSSWAPGRSFHDWLLDELYQDAGPIDAADPENAFIVGWPSIARGLDQIGVGADPVGDPVQGPRLTRYPLVLSGVDDFERLRKRLGDLAFAIGLASGGLVLSREQGERRVVLDVPRPSATWRTVPWATIRAELTGVTRGLTVSPGVDIPEHAVRLRSRRGAPSVRRRGHGKRQECLPERSDAVPPDVPRDS